MKVNRVISVNYSNINNRGRVLAAPNFGNASTLANQAVVDQFIASSNADRQRKRDMVEDPLGALSGKFRDLIGMFVPKSADKARQLQNAIDEYYSLASNNILNK